MYYIRQIRDFVWSQIKRVGVLTFQTLHEGRSTRVLGTGKNQRTCEEIQSVY